MKLYLSKTHSDEDGPMADEGKLAIIYSTREDIRNLTEFFNKVNTYLEDNEYCHMQFRVSPRATTPPKSLGKDRVIGCTDSQRLPRVLC